MSDERDAVEFESDNCSAKGVQHLLKIAEAWADEIPDDKRYSLTIEIAENPADD
jgi:hypothetical protein